LQRKRDQGGGGTQERLEAGSEAEQDVDWGDLFTAVLGNRERVEEEARLPCTGISLEMERLYSPIFIAPCMRDAMAYGTRSQTGIAVWRDGRVEVRERTIGPQGQVEGEQTLSFTLQASTGGLGAGGGGAVAEL
jgi:uncharacterized protein with NRDE domain